MKTKNGTRSEKWDVCDMFLGNFERFWMKFRQFSHDTVEFIDFAIKFGQKAKGKSTVFLSFLPQLPQSKDGSGWNTKIMRYSLNVNY